jgi:hypothetical protein
VCARSSKHFPAQTQKSSRKNQYSIYNRIGFWHLDNYWFSYFIAEGFLIQIQIMTLPIANHA